MQTCLEKKERDKLWIKNERLLKDRLLKRKRVSYGSNVNEIYGGSLNLVFEGIYFHTFAIFHKEWPVSSVMEKVWYSRITFDDEYKIIILYTASGINNNTRKVGALIKRKYIHRSRNCSYEPFQNNKRYPKLVYNYNIIITTFNMQLINDTTIRDTLYP